MQLNNRAATIVAELSSLIASSMLELESERSSPQYNADKSDDLIKFHTERVEVLREMRNCVENEMARQPNPGI